MEEDERTCSDCPADWQLASLRLPALSQSCCRPSPAASRRPPKMQTKSPLRRPTRSWWLQTCSGVATIQGNRVVSVWSEMSRRAAASSHSSVRLLSTPSHASCQLTTKGATRSPWTSVRCREKGREGVEAVGGDSMTVRWRVWKR